MSIREPGTDGEGDLLGQDDMAAGGLNWMKPAMTEGGFGFGAPSLNENPGADPVLGRISAVHDRVDDVLGL